MVQCCSVGNEDFAKKRNKVALNNFDIVFEDLAPCPRIKLPLHVHDGQLRHICKALVQIEQIVFGTEFVIKVMLTRHCLGFFKVTLACADAYPLPFNLERNLPTLGEKTLEVRAVEVTTNNIGDAPMLPELLNS